MKVVVLSTFGEYGGAAVCAKRLAIALNKHHVSAKLFTIHKYNGSTSFPLLNRSIWNWIYKWWKFIIERLFIFSQVKSKGYLYKFSSANIGLDILNNPVIQEADIIHLHWINFGFLSIKQIAELSKVKPVIWTMHDMWAFTGGCHYSMTCQEFQQECKGCFYLGDSKLSNQVWSSKMAYWSNEVLFKLAGTSNWLTNEAKKSAVFANYDVAVLPTPIDTSLFVPLEQIDSFKGLSKKDGEYYVLFGAVDLKDERKGFKYLLSALEILKSYNLNIHLITFGHMEGDNMLSGIKSTAFGSISDLKELNCLYNFADVFVLPSIQDNLPNTVMESMSTGTPVVAFNCGGVVDMIDHKQNGYIAELKNSNDLAEGIAQFQESELNLSASRLARTKVLEKFSEKVVVQKHMQIYNEVILNYNERL